MAEIVEHATRMSGGAMLVRNAHPDIERIYPLAEWLKLETQHGGKAYRRRVIVVSDWEEVPPQ